MERGDRGSTLRGLLAMVDAMGGRLESRIRLQKSAYLLGAAGVVDFRITSFKYHHYGPYSRSLSDALQDAVASGLLKETLQEYGDEQSKYTYELTDKGTVWLNENRDEVDPRVQQVAPLFKDTPWRALELAATALFVERDERIGNRVSALSRAIELKPPCAAYRSDAEQLLERIHL